MARDKGKVRRKPRPERGGQRGRGTAVTSATPVRATGHCLCGAVTFTVRGPLRSTVTACHCEKCRRFSGGLWAATVARKEHVAIKGAPLKWYRSSRSARRGFCGKCGSSLFWQGDGQPFLAISAAALDEPTGLTLICHGWTSEAGDYWEFGPGMLYRGGPSGLGPPRRGDDRPPAR